MILAEHLRWLESRESLGQRANLSGAILDGVDLSAADLRKANLVKANLSRANLRGAKLGQAQLGGANLESADLRSAELIRAEIGGANLRHAILMDSQLNAAILAGADLFGANMHRTKLIGAILSGADLSSADLAFANLSMVDLRGAKLAGSWGWISVDLNGALFEPESIPRAEVMAPARDLRFLIFDRNPSQLVGLRNLFREGGYREQERQMTYAMKRTETEWSLDFDPLIQERKEAARAVREPYWEIDRLSILRELRIKQGAANLGLEGRLVWSTCKSEPLNCIAYLFNRIFFDLTCQYGMSPSRPLLIGLVLWFLCAFVYTALVHTNGVSGLYRIETESERSPAGKTVVIQIRLEPLGSRKGVRKVGRLLLREWRVFRTAMFFSAMSAFNIGFRDINFGRWLRMLTRREYDIKAVGWARVVTGWQSLISVYLIALWVLTYFGRPFE